MQVFSCFTSQNLALLHGVNQLYKIKDRKTKSLFSELFPFGGELDKSNRWLKISELIPWDQLEQSYMSYFSDRGRPALDSRLVIGLLLLKHMTGHGDRDLVKYFYENPYWQAFCGYDHFVKEGALDPSALSKVRQRLGKKYFQELEEKTFSVLIERKIIKARDLMADGTVIEEHIRYPNDVSLLNDVREWLAGNLRRLGKLLGKKFRSYRRKGKQEYLNFSKKRKKTKKSIRQAKKKMLQFVRRNLDQMVTALHDLKQMGHRVSVKIKARLKVARQIFEQQREMYRTKSHRIENRIVSFYRPWVRPIKRGKCGKDVEFGPKASVTHVDGFMFLEKLSHDNFSEAGTDVVRLHIENYRKRFGQDPPSFVADRLYGSRHNRNYLDSESIRSGFCLLGRRRKERRSINRWLKQKQRKRNQVEGIIGHSKAHFGLDRIRYHGIDNADIWVRLSILGMNLQTALRKI